MPHVKNEIIAALEKLVETVRNADEVDVCSSAIENEFYRMQMHDGIIENKLNGWFSISLSLRIKRSTKKGGE